MAIIYTYPTKATPAADDLILISDSADSNKTKQVKVSALPSSGAGITLTTTGTSGPAELNGTVLNIPNYTTTGGTPDSPANSVQFNNAGAFGGSNELKYDNSTKTLTVGDQDVVRGIVSIAGGSSGAGELRLGDPGTSGGTVTLKGGNDHAASYTIKLPDDGPSANYKILESDASGNLTWISTPTGGPGSGTQYAIPFWSTTSALSDSILSQDASATKVVLAATKKLEIPNDGTTSATAINFGTANTGINGSGTTSIGLVSGGQSRIEVTTGFGGGQDITLTGLTQSDGGLRFGSNGETLNSYEEGSWTPTSANANTISSAVGDYTRVGDMVFAQFSFTMTGSTTVAIAGLPFQGVYTSALKGGAIISKNTCLSVQGQLKGGEFTGTNTFTFNAYFGSGTYNPNNPSVAALPYSLYTTTSSLYQTAGGTYAGIIIYETTE